MGLAFLGQPAEQRSGPPIMPFIVHCGVKSIAHASRPDIVSRQRRILEVVPARSRRTDHQSRLCCAAKNGNRWTTPPGISSPPIQISHNPSHFSQPCTRRVPLLQMRGSSGSLRSSISPRPHAASSAYFPTSPLSSAPHLATSYVLLDCQTRRRGSISWFLKQGR